MLLISCCVCAYDWPLGVLYIVLQYSGGHSEPVPCSIAGPGGEACWFLCVQLYTCGMISEWLRVVLVVPVVYMVHVSCVVVAAIEYRTPWCPLITLGGAAAPPTTTEQQRHSLLHASMANCGSFGYEWLLYYFKKLSTKGTGGTTAQVCMWAGVVEPRQCLSYVSSCIPATSARAVDSRATS